MTTKKFHVEVYGKDDLLIKEYSYDTKNEQLRKYYDLLCNGYQKSDLIKVTRQWYL